MWFTDQSQPSPGHGPHCVWNKLWQIIGQSEEPWYVLIKAWKHYQYLQLQLQSVSMNWYIVSVSCTWLKFHIADMFCFGVLWSVGTLKSVGGRATLRSTQCLSEPQTQDSPRLIGVMVTGNINSDQPIMYILGPYKVRFYFFPNFVLFFGNKQFSWHIEVNQDLLPSVQFSSDICSFHHRALTFSDGQYFLQFAHHNFCFLLEKSTFMYQFDKVLCQVLKVWTG